MLPQTKAEQLARIDAAMTFLHALWTQVREVTSQMTFYFGFEADACVSWFVLPRLPSSTQLGTTFECGYAAMTDDVTGTRLHEIQERIRLAQVEMGERTEYVKARLAESLDLLQGLCITDEENVGDKDFYDKILRQDVDGVGVHHQTLTQLDDMKAKLVAEKLRRQERLKSLAVRITALWDRLAITSGERQAFFGQHRGLGLQTLKFVRWSNARVVSQSVGED
jgi:hypothetical protein